MNALNICTIYLALFLLCWGCLRRQERIVPFNEIEICDLNFSLQLDTCFSSTLTD